jgi:hypothetical protein
MSIKQSKEHMMTLKVPVFHFRPEVHEESLCSPLWPDCHFNHDFGFSAEVLLSLADESISRDIPSVSVDQRSGPDILLLPYSALSETPSVSSSLSKGLPKIPSSMPDLALSAPTALEEVRGTEPSNCSANPLPPFQASNKCSQCDECFVTQMQLR